MGLFTNKDETLKNTSIQMRVSCRCVCHRYISKTQVQKCSIHNNQVKWKRGLASTNFACSSTKPYLISFQYTNICFYNIFLEKNVLFECLNNKRSQMSKLNNIINRFLLFFYYYSSRIIKIKHLSVKV